MNNLPFKNIKDTILNIKNLYKLGQLSSRNEMLQESLTQLEELNNSLRAQRHDFMNHLQVVYSLIELNEYDSTKEYIEKVYDDIQKISRVMRTSVPAVNALLQAKLLYAEKRGIKTEIIVKSQFLNLKIPAWEFCRILGNLIDNAIYSLQNLEGERLLTIELYEDIKNYYFNVSDNGAGISHENMGFIFNAGFTTKGDNGEGMGLAICKDILLSYGGDLSVSSTSSLTIFKGSIPNKNLISQSNNKGIET